MLAPATGVHVFQTEFEANAPRIDFELRHTREHLAKLKFTWLELQTKRRFLALLSANANPEDGDHAAADWTECGVGRWAPGDIKRLETETVDTRKDALRVVKAETNALVESINEACERIATASDSLMADRENVENLIEEKNKLLAEINRLESEIPEGRVGRRCAEEVQAHLDERGIAIERTLNEIDKQNAAIVDLNRLAEMSKTDAERSKSILDRLKAEDSRLSIQMSSDSHGTAGCVVELCRWYSGVREALSRVTGVDTIDLVRPDYLVVSLSPVGSNAAGEVVRSTHARLILHIYFSKSFASDLKSTNQFDSKSEEIRIREVRVGTAGGTPKRHWKEVFKAAIAFNDLPFLVRTIAASL